MNGTITQLEQELRQLIRTWERFFSGDIRVPPIREKTALARKLRHLSEHPPRQSSDRFRAEQLQHRYTTYAANWERLLREKEEGIQRGRPVKHSVAMSTAPKAESLPKTAATAANVPAAGTVRKTEDLYSRWIKAKAGLGQTSGMSREAFDNKLEAQKRQLEKKLGCRVKFDVKVDGNKVKLTARKIAAASNGES